MKILLITSFFPSLDRHESDGIGLAKSKFLYYYAAEWLKMGCEVLVIHCAPKYPRIFSKMVYFIEKQLRFDKLQLCNYYQKEMTIQSCAYNYKGVKIIRIPIEKYIPHRDFLLGSIKQLKKSTLAIIEQLDFHADFIISDFLTPASYLASEIRGEKKIPFYQILHLTDFNYLKKYVRLRRLLSRADGILHRSTHLSSEFKKHGLKAKFEDYIFSGVPEFENNGSARTTIQKFLFVGSLTPWKNVHILLKAFSTTKYRKKYHLDIVGDGSYETYLKLMTVDLGLKEQVHFHGRMPRTEVFRKMREADCFVMVSKGETFGMVYVEALSQGCIVIASRDSCGKSIIAQGKNGFLVDCNNIKELSNLFDHLHTLQPETIIQLSINAMKSTQDMTESHLAKKLLDKLTKHSKQIKQGHFHR